MIKFLVIEQDLRVSGTSQGIISRSFLGKLRIAYPDSIIDVVYLKQAPSNDQLELLPVNNIQTHVLNLKIPFLTKWLNKIYWRLFHISLKERHIHNVYKSYISKLDYKPYNHIFIRSGGLGCETLLGSKNLPILRESIITFNEPYPTFWCAGHITELTKLDLLRLKNMKEVVKQSKACMSTLFLAQDMQFLYGSQKKFYPLPHQYENTVFVFDDISQVFQKSKNVTITYHGALQFGRNIDIVLEAFNELLSDEEYIKENAEIILRLKSNDYNRLKNKYLKNENITVLEGVNFSNSCYEQQYLSDINLLLENGPLYCSVLLGKAPLLASFNKPIFVLSPLRSEIRSVIKNDKYLATGENKNEIKSKLRTLILSILDNESYTNPFCDYFSDEKFKTLLNDILLLK